MSTTFVLSRDGVAQIGTDSVGAFDSVAAARAALADGSVDVVTGALGFDTAGLAALNAPAQFQRSAPAPSVLAPRPATARVLSETSGDEHRERVVRALAAIDAGTVDKVVLARTRELLLDSAIAPGDLLRAFAHTARSATIFDVSLDPAGRPGHHLIGASPELLIRKSGRTLTCHPYAGTAARSADPAQDELAAISLRDSDKDRREHAFVVDALRAGLAPLCSELDIPAEPSLLSTGELWHLATEIRGELADDSVTALDLAAALSPTPAVGGTPRDAAVELIAQLESPRGFYAGTVGWCDANGDGEWLVTIRCLELAADHRTVTTWAGGGIVADSNPDAEVAETEAKFRTARRALGLE